MSAMVSMVDYTFHLRLVIDYGRIHTAVPRSCGILTLYWCLLWVYLQVDVVPRVALSSFELLHRVGHVLAVVGREARPGEG